MSQISIVPLTDTAMSLVGPDGDQLARYDWGSAKNHPYFSQVRPVRHAGIVTNHAPFDHRWHHGIWWSWKFINDVNFWEDHPGFGGTRNGLGRAHVTSHAARATSGGGILINEDVEWIPDADDTSLLSEKRSISVTLHEQSWLMDWTHSFVAQQDLTFAAVPYPEVSWGGYAGLNYRPARSMRAGEEILADGRRAGVAAVHGATMRWAAYGGLVDGAGTDSPSEPASANVAIIAHGGNPWPSRAYAATAADNFGFLSSAPLFGGDRQLAEGQEVTLRYRIAVFAGAADVDAIENLAADFNAGRS